MNIKRLAEVARIIEKLAPRQDVEDELMIRVNMQRLVTSPERHASITHLHMGVYHGTQKCGSVCQRPRRTERISTPVGLPARR